MLSLRLEASASVYDWIDPSQQSEPFGKGGAAILIDMTILVCVQIETWAPSAPWPNWTYEIRHYDQHLNLLGTLSFVSPYEVYDCYFVPIGGTNALLMTSKGDSSRVYYTAFVSASGAVPTIGAWTTRTSTNTSNWLWGRDDSRCQFVDRWSCIVLTNGDRSIHILDSSGAEVQVFYNATEAIGTSMTWNMRDESIYLSTYSQAFPTTHLSEFRLTRLTFSSYTLTKMGDFMPTAATGTTTFNLWGLGLAGASVDPQMLSWYGEYFPDPGPGLSSKFRWFKTADATTGTVLNTQDMVIVGDIETDFDNAEVLYPVVNFYSALNMGTDATYLAGQLGGEQVFTEQGRAGEYPSFAIHIIGIDPTTGEQRIIPLPIPGVHGEQDTLSHGSVTFCIRNHRWVVTCSNVNLDNFTGHDYYSFSVWTGSVHSLAMWQGSDWRMIGNKWDAEPGRLRLHTGDEWVEEVREGEDIGPTAVVPLYTTSGSFAAPWFATSASGYPQYSGWVAESTLSAFITKVGASPYIDQADAATNYVAISQSTDGGGNTIWVSTYWAPFTPTGEVVSAYIEFQVRGNGGTGDPIIRWGISGAQYYFSNYESGTEAPNKLAPNVWRTHRMNLFDERYSAQTKAKFLADLIAGDLNAGVNMDRAFDVSAIRLVLQYADEVTRPLKMWHPDAVGTFAGWVEVARMRPMP